MNHNPDIIDRLVDLAVRLHPDSDAGSAMCDAADEIERLRSLITEWADAGEKRANHLRSDNLTESIDKRHYDACEALSKAVGR